MKTYFCLIDADHWQAKNKSEARMKELARANNRIIVPDDCVEKFIMNFKVWVNQVNDEFPKCRELKLDVEKHDGDIFLYVDGVTHLQLYLVNPTTEVMELNRI